MVASNRSIRALATVLAVLALAFALGAPAARAADMQYQDLPANAKTYVEGIRGSCKELAGQEAIPSDPMFGISLVDLGDGTSALLLDNEHICAEWYAGANCSNRGCDLVVMAKKGQSWKETFNEHLYQKFISIGNDGKLKLITATIYAGDPHCHPRRGANFTSGETCDVLIRYQNKGWHWEKIQ